MSSEPAVDLNASRSADEVRVLLLPPTSRDALALQKVLAGAGVSCAVVPTIAALAAELPRGAGAAVVSEEALTADSASLVAHVRSQPVWSDLPVVILSRSGAETPAMRAVMNRLGDVTVLERPIRITTFLSVIKTALRARERQYQVRDHLAMLGAAQSEAERISRMKDEFLATLSHELRTPLNAILGWTQILQRDPADAEGVVEGLEVIERNARVQTQIIEDLLDMSRIINGKVSLAIEPVDLASVLRTALETVRPAADAKQIRIDTDYDPPVSTVNGDANRLLQVFWNLLSNAVKFTPRGGRIRVILDRTDSLLRVRVIDSGEGIDPRFLPHVFDRFRQADSSTTRRHGGLGLGLSIVRQLTELHGGTVAAASDGPGRGSTFIVFIPPAALGVGHEKTAAIFNEGARTPKAPTPDRASLAGIRVLVVDDEPDARGMLRRALEDCNAVVVTASSAAEAFDRLKIDRPDVMVSDIGMPGEDGYALIHRVRDLPPDHGGTTPAIALTAYARADDRTRAIQAGYQKHLSKPVEPPELVAIIASLAGTATPVA
jgi:signal transduction histidine kinase/ActR/RegA family two-component response regulator